MIKSRTIIGTILLLLILCSSSNLAAQSKLLLTDVKIARGDGRFDNYAEKTANLASDVPVTILLYRDNDVSYYANFLYTQRGKRLKLTVHDYVIYNGEKIMTKKQVMRQRMDADLDMERMMGFTEEEIIYNAALDSKLRVIYRFELLY